MSLNTYSLDLELGSSQYASISDASQTGLDITGDISIECWVKVESEPGSGDLRLLVSKQDAGSANNYQYAFDYFNNGGTKQLRFAYYSSDANVTSFSFNTTLTAGTWYHIAVTVDVSAQTSIFYVNGSGTAGTVGATNATSIQNGAGVFIVGARKGASVERFWDGLIDEVRVWSDIRSGAEILANYQKELVGTEANLAGYWKFNNNYLDETSNNNDLTATNTPVFSTDVPFVGSIATTSGTDGMFLAF